MNVEPMFCTQRINSLWSARNETVSNGDVFCWTSTSGLNIEQAEGWSALSNGRSRVDGVAQDFRHSGLVRYSLEFFREAVDFSGDPEPREMHLDMEVSRAPGDNMLIQSPVQHFLLWRTAGATNHFTIVAEADLTNVWQITCTMRVSGTLRSNLASEMWQKHHVEALGARFQL